MLVTELLWRKPVDKKYLQRNVDPPVSSLICGSFLTTTVSNSAVPASGFAIYRRLLSYVGQHHGKMALGILAMVVYAATTTSFAALMKPMLDGSFVERDQSTIALVPLLILLVFFCRGIAGFMSTYLMSTLQGDV